jgi:CelD/BcsL family acetyltransferase involved in cellulose biosynthesis
MRNFGYLYKKIIFNIKKKKIFFIKKKKKKKKKQQQQQRMRHVGDLYHIINNQ